MIVGLHLINFNGRDYAQRPQTAKSLYQENALEAFIILAFLFLVHVSFLILQVRQELVELC